MPDTPKPPHPILRAILPPLQTGKHREDRLKALAGLFQTTAMRLLGVGIFTPVLSSTQSISRTHLVLIGVSASLAEVISLTLLMYIPYPKDKEEQDNE